MDFIKQILNNTKDIILALGLIKGLFFAFFFIMHLWIFLLYKGRIKDRQKEIDRLAAENREYRERFLAFYDEKFNYIPPKSKHGKEKEKG
ncbi:MAG: hypothetical protein DYG83_01595 [Candidatus Brocadia sp. AMX2]|uniref:Cobalamin biosynthesis protein n=1 Tax=Candidatus Brocadia sinica JPN1 TaxID=1197129 RepID=A0ABQ0JW84_9BACT|nr:hypothetical protein [Candidatus Brocadia sinica]KAA0245518.1 MAG: hypothetical protein EDM70_01140 [Candidatus Brocadia sp. AMX2]MBC6930844.1 hypothetical protein [Candidatus Brocadia sp.]MBL1167813.1 hypothetical protein [Candidatus Brocadia sp. AMX1]NOG41427.1 hypothetical protein [Planctomycetota bacterium]MCE7865519.1 hypothetical protein [Candidatus Brocadia sp. AMX2]